MFRDYQPPKIGMTAQNMSQTSNSLLSPTKSMVARVTDPLQNSSYTVPCASLQNPPCAESSAPTPLLVPLCRTLCAPFHVPLCRTLCTPSMCLSTESSVHPSMCLSAEPSAHPMCLCKILHTPLHVPLYRTLCSPIHVPLYRTLSAPSAHPPHVFHVSSMHSSCTLSTLSVHLATTPWSPSMHLTAILSPSVHPPQTLCTPKNPSKPLCAPLCTLSAPSNHSMGPLHTPNNHSKPPCTPSACPPCTLCTF